MAPRRRCTTCGSKQWHKEPSSGLIACSEGHVLQNYRNEATEADEMGPHAVRKRTLKSGRQKKEKGSKADPRLYHGARGRYHYFQCQQLLLRMQVQALIKLWDLPAEFEVVCRDIWALHLELLSDPPRAEPSIYAQQSKETDEMGDGIRDSQRIIALTPETDQATPPPITVDETADNSSETDNENDLDEGEEDPDLAELLQEISETSSSSDEENEQDEQAKPKQNIKALKKAKGRLKYEGPMSTVAVLMMGCWMMRIPVMYRDFAKVIESYELPYLDPVRLLPASMVLHLTKHDVQALSPYHAPVTLILHALTSRLAKRLYSTYNIFTPEVNAAPILWRVIQGLGGTPTLYMLTKRLSDILSLPLTLHHTLAPGLRVKKKRDPESHQYDNVPPELGFLAASIIVLKMVYGLDGRIRRPEDPGDPACALPRIDEYVSVLKKLDEAESKTKEAVFNSRANMMVSDLSTGMMDEYLGFCERALLVRAAGVDEGVLGRYFPLGQGSVGGEVEKGAGYVYEGIAATRANGEGELRPGEGYVMYHWRDVMGSVGEMYGEVVGRGGGYVCVGGGDVGGVVEKYERRVVGWWGREKRRWRDGRLRGGEESWTDDDDDEMW